MCAAKVMPLLNRVRIWGLILATTITFGAAAQTASLAERLLQGQQMHANGRNAEARTIFLSLLRDTRNDPPDDRRDAIVLDSLGLSEMDSGKYAEAETAFNRALSTLHASGAGDSVLADLKTHLAELYVVERRPTDAEPLLRQALAIRRSEESPAPVTRSLTYNVLAMACTMQGKRQEAETLLRQALALLEAELGPNDPALTGSLFAYAGLLMSEHRFADAVAPAERAWQILHSNVPDVAAPYLAGASGVLSAVYLHMGRTVDAESFARQAVELAEAAFGRDQPQVGFYLAHYAAVLKRQNRKKEALEIQHRADAILAKRPAANLGGLTINVDALR
jgi:tetratricopeptide (TPR) repeat protein